MTTVMLGVRSLKDSLAGFRTAWTTGKAAAARIDFASPELLWKVLTAKRWEVLRAMCGQGPMSIRAIVRGVNRDVKAVYGDVRALTLAGVLEKAEDGRAVFPYDAVRVDFLLRAA